MITRKAKIAELSMSEAQKAVEPWLPSERAIWWEAGQLHSALPRPRKTGKGTQNQVYEQARARIASAIVSSWAPLVAVRPGTTVVVPVTPPDVPAFVKNWPAMRWSDDVPILIMAGGLNELESQTVSSTVAAGSSAEIVVLEDALLSDLREGEPFWTAVATAAATHVVTRHWAYLDPMFHPTPGAELFAGPEFASCAVAFPGWAFQRITPEMATLGEALGRDPTKWRPGGILKHLKIGPPATFWQTETSRRAIEAWRAGRCSVSFEVFLTAWLPAVGAEAREVAFPRQGWQS